MAKLMIIKSENNAKCGNNCPKKRNKAVFFAGFFIGLFLALTYAVKFYDVAAIGPNGSTIGLSAINALVRDFVGINQNFYAISEKLGLVAIAVAGCICLAWFLRLFSKAKRADRTFGAYIVLMVLMAASYVLFEKVVINYRPVLINGVLEASFPSSHVLLSMCTLGGAAYVFGTKIKGGFLRFLTVFISVATLIAIVALRTMSGVHWASDILGGLLLSAAWLAVFVALCKKQKRS